MRRSALVALALVVLVPLARLRAQAGLPAGSGRPDSVEASRVHRGRARQTTVAIPRFEGSVTIDGDLDEAPWRGAAVLTDFSQFHPVDGRPSLDSTVAYVWYGPDAIYFAARAYAPAGTVRGTLADRDKIQNDDHVQFILDTFNDRRQAFVFAVNPLGVQSDGIRTEGGMGGGRGRGGGMFSRANLTNADLNQDLIWQSKGRITDTGYQVEIRVPFKSIRYRGGDAMAWGLNVVRTTQRNNYQDTWSPASRGVASFLIQSGRLTGLRDLRRGLVLDVTPVLTSSIDGADDGTGAWRYTARPRAGGDVRWGVTSNLTLNGTINPDFSQVEADVGQIASDIRFALFFPELRPFFVEGNEQIDTPNQLVYTRRIVQPVAATKLTGKVSRFDVGVLSAVDARSASASGLDHPLVNVVRLRRDVGAQNNVAVTITDRRVGGDYNRVFNTDGRFVLRQVYQASYQVAASDTRTGGARSRGTIWEASFDRTGRNYGFRNSIEGVSEAFATQVGFVPRLDYVQPQMNQRVTWFGRRGARLEQLMVFLSGQGTWTYAGFAGGDAPLETRLSVSPTFTFRGGWSASLTPSLERFAFQPERYADYFVERRTGARVDTVPFTVGPAVAGRQLQARLTTPQFRRFGASLNGTVGRDAEFLETAQARRFDVNATLDLRPTPQLRVNALMLHQQFRRVRDNSVIVQSNIPRLRVEYQLSRAIFLRFVGQYESRRRDLYRDPRTEAPILLRDAGAGTWTRGGGTAGNGLRADWLFSYLPSPGKVLYVGYGASLEEPQAFRFRQVERTRDGLFVKFSWLYRVP